MLPGGESAADVAAAITGHPSSRGAFVCLFVCVCACEIHDHFVSRACSAD
jgi:hypothetical protein